MAWRRRALYSTCVIELFDREENTIVRITRRCEDYDGYHSFGRFSYKGERLRLFGADGDAEDYPPPLRRCRTKRAREWWKKQSSVDN